MGLVVGLLVGLALALGVALYITKAPVPFINKVPQRTAEQDTAETERNRNWDPNGPLAGKGAPRPAAARFGHVAAEAASLARRRRRRRRRRAAAPAKPPARAPAAAPGRRQHRGGPARPAALPVDAFVYFVQAGAYTRSEDAEQQRARLALMGHAGPGSPSASRSAAPSTACAWAPSRRARRPTTLHGQLQEQRIDAQIVRVERP